MKKRWIAAYIFIFCSIMIVVSLIYWDIALMKYCRTLNPTIKKIADVITTFANTTWYIVICFILYLFFRFIYKNKLNTMRSLFVFLSLSFTGIFITILKWIAGRHRPGALFNHGYFGFDYFGVGYELTSFPSGHTQTAFTLATALTILYPRWGIPLFIIAGLVSISRIILNSHYLSDVIAGAGVGILCTLAVKYYFDCKQIKLTTEM